jgi:transcriptional regulator with XRE-family HTH domain
LGAAITQARLEAGLGLADLASRLNMGVEQLEALESGDLARLPEPVFVIAQARRIAQNLGVTIDGEIQALRQTNILNSRPTEVQNLKLNAESVEGRGPEANQARWGQGSTNRAGTGAEAFEGLRLAAQRLEDKLSEVEELQQRLDHLLKGHED